MTVSRADYIAGLRALADLLERTPEIPHYEYGAISFAVGGTDEEAFATIDAAAAALESAKLPFDRYEGPGAVRLEFDLVGVRYEFSRMDERKAAEYEARRSYESSVQVDAPNACETTSPLLCGGA